MRKHMTQSELKRTTNLILSGVTEIEEIQKQIFVHAECIQRVLNKVENQQNVDIEAAEVEAKAAAELADKEAVEAKAAAELADKEAAEAAEAQKKAAVKAAAVVDAKKAAGPAAKAAKAAEAAKKTPVNPIS